MQMIERQLSVMATSSVLQNNKKLFDDTQWIYVLVYIDMYVQNCQ